MFSIGVTLHAGMCDPEIVLKAGGFKFDISARDVLLSGHSIDAADEVIKLQLLAAYLLGFCDGWNRKDLCESIPELVPGG